MPQSKILVDTNTYLRLAKTIRPLLFETFGENEYCLYILPELNGELSNSKLQNKFHWVNEEEFCVNRKHSLHRMIGKLNEISALRRFRAIVIRLFGRDANVNEI